MHRYETALVLMSHVSPRLHPPVNPCTKKTLFYSSPPGRTFYLLHLNACPRDNGSRRSRRTELNMSNVSVEECIYSRNRWQARWGLVLIEQPASTLWQPAAFRGLRGEVPRRGEEQRGENKSVSGCVAKVGVFYKLTGTFGCCMNRKEPAELSPRCHRSSLAKKWV